MAKDIEYGYDARINIRKGINKIANTVKLTLGPCGKTVILDKKFGSPNITKDGVSVAKEVESDDNYENIGIDLIKEVASKTNDGAGDGTTTATVLAQSIYNEGLKYIELGARPVEVKKGIDLAVNTAIKDIKNTAKKIEDNKSYIEQVAAISANNDKEIGEMISKAMSKVGKDGVITVEESRSIDTKIKIVEGMEFDRGYLSSFFATNTEKMIAEMDNPYILIYDKKISTLKEVLPILEKVVQNGKPLLIIADDVDGEALTTLAVNKLRGAISVCAVKAPGFGDRKKEILEDIAVMTGGKVISKEKDMKIEDATIEDLGKAEKVNVTKDNTLIVNGLGNKEDIELRANVIRKQIENTKSEYDIEKLRERLAKLTGGVAILYIGAPTETEMKEKKDRADDAVHATKAAIEEGIIPGGGVTLLRCSENLKKLKGDNDDQNIGIKIVYEALRCPIKIIVQNRGEDAGVVINEILKNKNVNYGFNARTGEYQDLIEAGVVDPAKVTRLALQNAASMSSILLTTECVIVEKKQNNTFSNGKEMNEGMGMM